MPSISALIANCPVSLRPRKAWQEQSIQTLTTDSRQTGPNSCFVCMKGWITDGHRFAPDAYAAGCRCFFTEEPLQLPADANVIPFPDMRAALPWLAQAFYGFPQEGMRIVGITGTKGKTTVAWLLYEVLAHCGLPCGIIGTVGIRYGTVHLESKNTTPDPLTLYQTLAKMKNAGVQTVLMEVSSQALLTHRVDSLSFDTAIYTNLSNDHVSAFEHPSFANYKACKMRLFRQCDFAVLNRDDAYFGTFAAATPVPYETYGFSPQANWRIEQNDPTEQSFRLYHGPTGVQVPFSMPGPFNLQNAAAVLCTCEHFGVAVQKAAPLLALCTVPGRFERVEGLPGISCIIDYAHNGASAELVLRCARKQNPRRLIVLYGSVGGRTQLRREELGTVCAELADFSILTADNPDFEDPQTICNEIASFYDDPKRYTIIPDRANAINYAIHIAQPGDMLLFLGKGHETYQLIRGIRQPFCERELIRAAIQQRLSLHPPAQEHLTREEGKL